MSNSFEKILSELVSQPQNSHFWFNAAKDLFAYHYNRKRGLAIRRPRQGMVVDLPLGVFFLRNNGSYTPQIALQDQDNKYEFLCLEYSDTTSIDGPIAQAVLLDFCMKRYQIIDDPRAWYDTWAKMVGNTLAEVKPYPVLAELLMLKKLMDHDLVRDLSKEWTGPNKQLHDIELTDPSVSVEVKSSTKRGSSKVVTVSSAFQLDPINEKPLYLAFCVFQASSPEDGLTIERVIQEFGPDYHDILTEHCKMTEGGLGWNDNAASVVSWSYYRIDSNFPKITPLNFEKGILPKGIIKIIYDIDLASAKEMSEEEFFDELNSFRNRTPPCGEDLYQLETANDGFTDIRSDSDDCITEEEIPVASRETTVAGRRANITCVQAAIQTLREHNTPMNAKEIVDAMVKDHIYQFGPNAKTPNNSVSSRLTTYMKDCEANAKRCLVKKIDGKFAFADYNPDAQNAQLPEEPAASTGETDLDGGIIDPVIPEQPSGAPSERQSEQKTEDVPQPIASKGNSGTMLDVAIQTLKRLNKPMKARDLVEAMKQSGFNFGDNAKTPENSISSQFSIELKGNSPRIKKIGRGTFAHADYKGPDDGLV